GGSPRTNVFLGPFSWLHSNSEVTLVVLTFILTARWTFILTALRTAQPDPEHVVLAFSVFISLRSV
ncbi:hypothetical protein RFX40_08750, partial [Acinetobacter baumannii]|nr:hypothetical protein [Acinetobacter baumannii]